MKKVVLLALFCLLILGCVPTNTTDMLTETDPQLHADGGKWGMVRATIADPFLPRVLLIGDSILMGYGARTIKALEGKANVDAWLNPLFQSEKLNIELAKVLENGPYEVVHFNVGLHGWREGRIKPGTFEPLTREYVQIIRDKMPKAKLIWANTTPFTIKGKPTDLDPVINANILEQNRMAANVMAEMNIPVNDFYGLLINKLELGRGDTVHWTPPASQILADKAVASILQALDQKTAASPKAKPRVVCFGDSITKRGYPAELANLLSVTVANAGIAGNTSRQGLARMQKDVLDLKPELVVIFFGTNDCRMAHEQVYVPPQLYEENLITMVENCERLGIKTVLCTLPPINAEVYFQRTPREKFDEAGGLAKVLESYRAAALRVAEVNHIPSVDLNRLLESHPEWMAPDGVHPTTPEGNRLIARFVAEKVRPLLKIGTPTSNATDVPASVSPRLGAVSAAFASSPAAGGSFDVVVYGGTSAGVIAAVQVARLGKSVVLIEPGKHIGGMTTGGLGNTDVGKAESIGGTTREFYRRVLQWYQVTGHWKFFKNSPSPQELAEADKGKRIAADAMFVFEPHVADTLLTQMLAEAKVPVVFGERLDLKKGVEKTGARIVSIRMESGREFTGKTFLDCTYEGDLMACAGVAYTVGREANAQYGETYNGVQVSEEKRKGERPLDPYVTPGVPGSGLIAGLQADVVGKVGDADRRVQAYNYRLCLTAQPENRVPFDQPAGYDEKEFELLFRWLEAGNTKGLPVGLNPIPNAKTDSNKAGWVSTDYIGQCDDYPDADYAKREQITQAHIRYTKGLLWTLANHPRVPESVRRRASGLGYAKDEFVDTGHFPHQLYVREARRMLGEHIMTEHEALGARKVADPVALGSYGMDAHPTQLWVDQEGFLRADTPIWKGVAANGYGISYRSLTPKAAHCSNLLVPVCLSASHSVYGSLRMEPVYMMLGQAAATAAVLALDGNVAVQNVSYEKLRDQLLKDGQILKFGDKNTAIPKNAPETSAPVADKDNPADTAADAASWAAAQDSPATAPPPASMAWWKEAKFGMFIHWGVYSKAGGEWNGETKHAEWLQLTAKIPLEEYKAYARTFNPVQFNADEWVKIAKDAGMKYLVITSKHHDGFAMFDSQCNDHNIVKGSAFNRDPLKELAEACRKQGLHFCVYYSLGRDWEDPDVPTGSGSKAGWRSNLIDFPDESKKDFSKYFERKVKPQVRELLTNYGPIGIMWFDTYELISHEQSAELFQMIRKLQPECIINNRIGRGLGDYSVSEQQIPVDGSFKPWEACMTLNNHWGYNKADQNWKSSEMLLRNLIDIVSKGGNYLLNVGPTGEGVIPEPSVERLTEMGQWLRVNGEAIYGCGPTPFGPKPGIYSDTEKDEDGTPKFIPARQWRATTRPGMLYIHIFEWPAGTMELPAVKSKITKAYLLADLEKTELKVIQTETRVSISLPEKAPNPIASVVCLEMASN